MTENNNATEKKNDTLAFIIGGLFILGLVFATYNYFNESGRLDSAKDENGAISLEKLKETLSAKTGGDDDSEEGAVDEGEEGTKETTAPTENTWTANKSR